MAEGQSSRLRLQFTDAADVIVVQVDVLKLLLFLHVGGKKGRESESAPPQVPQRNVEMFGPVMIKEIKRCNYREPRDICSLTEKCRSISVNWEILGSTQLHWVEPER